ncbi:LysR family transcriptional regulator [Pseudoflavonifractor sp. 60]|nr:LysR family transcriptional regulator [Pseudoflavonifractor sp. 60]NBI68317.1 LysR family transcriptional regulator [Pseudoflavonifractor sp. 60]
MLARYGYLLYLAVQWVNKGGFLWNFVFALFLLAAREENITRAAELLHVTQPTLSRQFIQLEQELGTKLFHRGQHSITLTDDGILLKRRAQELIDLAGKTEREFVKTEGSLTGELSIGSGEILSMHTLSQWIATFRQENPLVQYNIYSATADEIKDRLEKGILDMGLLVGPMDILSAIRNFYRILLNPPNPLKTKGFKQVNNSIPVVRSCPLLRASRELAREKSREI